MDELLDEFGQLTVEELLELLEEKGYAELHGRLVGTLYQIHRNDGLNALGDTDDGE